MEVKNTLGPPANVNCVGCSAINRTYDKRRYKDNQEASHVVIDNDHNSLTALAVKNTVPKMIKAIRPYPIV